jgi:hypothetical protein
VFLHFLESTTTAPAAGGDQTGGLANDLLVEFSGTLAFPNSSSFDYIFFEASYGAWLRLPPNKRHEPQLTSTLARSMGTQLEDYCLDVQGQEEVVPDELTGGERRECRHLGPCR